LLEERYDKTPCKIKGPDYNFARTYYDSMDECQSVRLAGSLGLYYNSCTEDDKRYWPRCMNFEFLYDYYEPFHDYSTCYPMCVNI